MRANETYVIGHINPDSDAVASAVGYAWFLRERDGSNVIAARAGHLNPQTTWVFETLGLEPPVLMTDASPRFEDIVFRYDTTTPDQPLRKAWAIMTKRNGYAPIVNPDGTPHGMVTVFSLFSFLQTHIGTHSSGENMLVKELMDIPCAEACDKEVPRFPANGRIRDSLTKILREERDEFWVVDEDGRYKGVCRQQDALNPPRYRVILVDHNEASQSISYLNEADLLEVLDHHRLGNPTTTTPIRFTVDVVGSTCTLVSERIAEAGLSAPPALAGLLLSGLLADTLVLTSPTTTQRDHDAAARLGRWAFVGGSPLAGETIQSFGEKLLQSGAGLSTRSPDEIISADFKEYEGSGFKFGLAQVEVTNLNELTEHNEELLEALFKIRERKGMDFAMLMVTDVVRKNSILLLTDNLPQLDNLPYGRLDDDHTRDAKGLVSRKKQLLPAVLAALSV